MVMNQGIMSGGLRPPILKFSFQNPMSWVMSIVHCVLIIQGVMSWGFRPALPLTGGSDPEGLYRGVYVCQSSVIQLLRFIDTPLAEERERGREKGRKGPGPHNL